MLVGMLRCETGYRHRRRLTRRVARWSFAALIVGAGVLDATVFAPEPTRVQANVELPAQDDPPPPYLQITPSIDDQIAEAIDEALLTGASPIDWLESGARPHNRVELAGGEIRLRNAAADLMPIELQVADCADGVLTTGLREVRPIKDGRVAGRFHDGTYRLTTSCDGRTIVTTLIVE
jgi:hypothetical protein